MTIIKRRFETQFPPFKGLLEIWLLDEDGNVLQYIKARNLVVNTGRELIAHLVGAGGNEVDHIGIGTNGAAAQPGDVAPLTEQFEKAFSQVTYPDQRSVAFSFVIATTEFNGKIIREFGLLRSEGGNPETFKLFTRRGGFEIEKDETVQVQGTWTVTF